MRNSNYLYNFDRNRFSPISLCLSIGAQCEPHGAHVVDGGEDVAARLKCTASLANWALQNGPEQQHKTKKKRGKKYVSIVSRDSIDSLS